MTNLNILLIASIPFHFENVKGGVESAVVNLITGFVLVKNIQVHVLSIRPDIKQPIEVVYSNNITIYYFPYGKINNPLIEYAGNSRRIVTQMVKRINPDLIHYQCIDPGLMSVNTKFFYKLVATQHGIISEEKKYQTGIYKKSFFLIKSFFEAYYLQKIQNIVLISEYNKKIISEMLKTRVRTKLIRNAVNKDFFSIPIKKDVGNKLYFVGTITKLKNVHFLLETMARLNGQGYYFTLDIIGDYQSDEYKKIIEGLISKHQMENQVCFHGRQPQSKIIEIITDLDIFILPSQQESLPVSIAEAMAAGKIVLASNVGGINEMFDDTISGFLFNKNTFELEGLLKNVLNNYQMIPVAKNAREKAIIQFHPDSIAKKTADFYKELLIN